MSTKLYNGHRMNAMSMNQLIEFHKELRSKSKVFLREQYLKLVANRMYEITMSIIRREYEIRLAEEKYGIDSDEYLKCIKYMDNTLIDIYRKNMSFARLCDEHFNIDKYKKELDIENIRKNLSYHHFGSVMSAAIDSVENEARRIQITHERNDSFDFYGSICVMSNENISGNKTLFLVYGSLLEDYFNELLDSEDPDDIAFVKKYGIEEYMYYNNTDRPDVLTEEEWDLRRQDWDYALPTGVPSDAGITLDMFNEWTYFSDWMFEVLRNKALIGDLFVSTDDIIKKMTYNIVNENFLDKYCEEHNDGDELQYHVVMDAMRAFKKLYCDKDKNIIKQINDTETKIRTLNILSNCDIINANILDIASSYKAYIEKEK